MRTEEGAIARRTPWRLIALFIVAGAVWVFVTLAETIKAGATLAFDSKLLLSFRNPQDKSDPIGPHWVEELVRDFTGIGGVGVLTLLVFSAAGFLWLQGKRLSVGFLFASVLGGILTSQILKALFDRPRPDLVPHFSNVANASFPSGHSLMAAVVYLTLGVMIARIVSKRIVKVYVMLLAVCLAAMVGVSRVYLGVHWPTDVLGGWIVGAAWVLLCWCITSWSAERYVSERNQSTRL